VRHTTPATAAANEIGSVRATESWDRLLNSSASIAASIPASSAKVRSGMRPSSTVRVTSLELRDDVRMKPTWPLSDCRAF
jgi:hypothetical protein